MRTALQFDSSALFDKAKLKPIENPNCRKPLVAWKPRENTEKSRLRHALPTDEKMRFFNSEPPAKSRYLYERMEFSCKQCTACRLNKSMEWAGRIMAEAKLYGDDNCFVTLTYNDEHLPEHGNLVLRDIQLFKKRLRKVAKGVHPVFGVKLKPNQSNPIRTFESGEFGDQFGRPHYHLAIMNYKPKDLIVSGKNKQGDKHYRSQQLSALWGKGHVTIGDLTVASAAYIARYVVKKVNGEKKDEHYSRVDQETGEMYSLKQEFATMSRKPGIGVPYFHKYTSDFMDGKMLITTKKRTPSKLPNGMPFIAVSNQTISRKIPALFEKLLEDKHPELVEKLKEERKKYLLQHQIDYPEEYTEERRAVKEIVFNAKIKSLKR